MRLSCTVTFFCRAMEIVDHFSTKSAGALSCLRVSVRDHHQCAIVVCIIKEASIVHVLFPTCTFILVNDFCADTGLTSSSDMNQAMTINSRPRLSECSA